MQKQTVAVTVSALVIVAAAFDCARNDPQAHASSSDYENGGMGGGSHASGASTSATTAAPTTAPTTPPSGQGGGPSTGPAVDPGSPIDNAQDVDRRKGSPSVPRGF